MTQIEFAALLGWGTALVCFFAWVKRYYKYLELQRSMESAQKINEVTIQMLVDRSKVALK
jgi:hypothetical protein